MTLREAQGSDRGEIARMAAAFLGPDGPYFGRFTPSASAVDRLFARMLEPGALALVLEEAPGQLVGMLGAFLFEHPIAGLTVASELCWWVDPTGRGSRQATVMVSRALAWAHEAGAAWFEMIAPNERVGEFYERIGFERTDTHYVKVIR